MTRAAKGFTVLEMLVVISLGVILLVSSVPLFLETLRRVRHGAATRQVLADVRQARSKAIATGWDYRIVGYDADGAGARRNSYRIIARRAPAAWPAEDSVAFEGQDQSAGAWFDLGESYSGVTLDTNTPRFELTFDSRGAAPGAAASFNPLRLVGSQGEVASLSVSTVGGIRIQ